ncbi:MAG TPA: hypothetical protein VJ793_12390 [Anaerolineae bacterium]|nr:hypothetical protein [Anaerolineae bacterium]
MVLVSMTGAQRRHRQAALTYAGLGLLVIAITFLAGLVPRSRTAQLAELGIGAVFIAIFAALIWRGGWLLSALLVIPNTWRAFTYFNDGRGLHIELAPFSVTPIEPKPVAFVNAALMVVIVVMLARSARAGFSAWRAVRKGTGGTKGTEGTEGTVP